MISINQQIIIFEQRMLLKSKDINQKVVKVLQFLGFNNANHNNHKNLKKMMYKVYQKTMRF